MGGGREYKGGLKTMHLDAYFTETNTEKVHHRIFLKGRDSTVSVIHLNQMKFPPVNLDCYKRRIKSFVEQNLICNS